jgi:hypothetical protein
MPNSYLGFHRDDVLFVLVLLLPATGAGLRFFEPSDETAAIAQAGAVSATLASAPPIALLAMVEAQHQIVAVSTR